MITAAKIKKFIEIAQRDLEGEFVLLGGTLLPFFDDEYRVTIDIDFISIGESSSNRLQIQLMNIAEQINIPVESINMSAGFFLEKIKNFKSELVLISGSEKVKIFRPSVFLYLDLKCRRLSSSDKDDCIHYMKLFKEETRQQKKKIAELLKNFQKSSEENISGRVLELKNYLSKFG